MAQKTLGKREMKVGDEVLILKKDSAEHLFCRIGLAKYKNGSRRPIGYIGLIDGDRAYVNYSRLPYGVYVIDYPGWWWKLQDLQIIGPNKWRRQKCV